MVLRFQSLEVERTRKMERNRGLSPPYIEGNPSTAFAARLIPQYESHTRVTKEIIQFVVNLAKEIPYSNRLTKERTPKLSQHVSHQGTVRQIIHPSHTLKSYTQTIHPNHTPKSYTQTIRPNHIHKPYAQLIRSNHTPKPYAQTIRPSHTPKS